MSRISALLAVLILGILAVYFINSRNDKNKPLPVIQPADVNPVLVDGSIQRNKGGHKIAPFTLKNQLSEEVTEKTLTGKIYVANFFFTTCPTICPAMNSNVKRVYEQYKNFDNVLFVSHTVMPETDTVEQLFAYAERMGVDHKKWLFLTGEKDELYRLARLSYLVAPAMDNPDFTGHTPENDFIHTENIVLVDKKARIRGIYDGLNKNEMDKLITDIERLLAEE
jgi:protein SCO1